MEKEIKITTRIEDENDIKEIIKSSYPLKNDAFVIFAQNIEFCQEFLRVILQDENLVVIENDIQKNLPTIFSKYAVIDLLCKLSDGTIVNVEIQLTYEEEHATRVLYYASKIRVYTTKEGTPYKDFNNIVVIYLTKEDAFGKGSTVYEVNMDVISDKGEKVEKWDAKLKVYYVNTKGLTNTTINEYLKLLTDKTTLNEKYKITSEMKKDLYECGGKNMSKEMMSILERAERRGKLEGRAEGRAEGREEGGLNIVLSMFKKHLIKLEDAVSELGISEIEFLKLANA